MEGWYHSTTQNGKLDSESRLKRVNDGLIINHQCYYFLLSVYCGACLSRRLDTSCCSSVRLSVHPGLGMLWPTTC